MTRTQKITLARIVLSAALLVAVGFLPLDGWARLAAYLVPYGLIGYDILYEAMWGIAHGQLLDENFLMATATVGAFALAVTGRGEYSEAVAVMLFYQIGEWFQSYAVGKSRRSIASLMEIRPDVARVARDGALIEIDPAEVTIGETMVVHPGERVPLDGVLTEGETTLDTAALTGESLPRSARIGDTVLSGCINLTGLIHVRVTKGYDESTVAKILELVENASTRKAKSEDFIARFARVYTPAVCGGALLLAILPPLGRLLLGMTPLWGAWIYRALTFLVISCPCALVISIPLSFFAGIGGASRIGVLVKGANYLEQLAAVDTVVFDKTGTLTEGRFAVTSLTPVGVTEETLLAYAAHAESASTHPIADSLCRAYTASGASLRREAVTNVTEVGGRGVTADYARDGRSVHLLVGSARLLAEHGVAAPCADDGGTTVYVAADGVYVGKITVADCVKGNAAEAIAALRRAGVRETVLLSGDRAAAAQSVAAALGIDTVHAELLPGDKVARLEDILAAHEGRGQCAFVGDGINDAPVLARADVGIAMGALGSDAAIEAADVVLMDDDPMKIARAMAIARRTLAIVRQNIVFAIGVKALCLLLGAIGAANMGVAIFADVGVLCIAVCNAMRALRTSV